jgi:hypothetical protein
MYLQKMEVKRDEEGNTYLQKIERKRVMRERKKSGEHVVGEVREKSNFK